MDRDAHNPDINAEWTPLVANRVYACSVCGTEDSFTTNHTGTVWAHSCAGKCRDIRAPNTARERVIWRAPRAHFYVREA